MLTPLIIGCVTAAITVAIQIYALVVVLRFLMRRIDRTSREQQKSAFDFRIISGAMALMFFGHMFQVAVWAVLFRRLGEFEDFATAFYHSMVNFASLGYGDIVMSEQWRLLGAIEASVGVLMFGLTAGIMIALIQALFSRHGNGPFSDDDD